MPSYLFGSSKAPDRVETLQLDTQLFPQSEKENDLKESQEQKNKTSSLSSVTEETTQSNASDESSILFDAFGFETKVYNSLCK
jgi:hypothetical protein